MSQVANNNQHQQTTTSTSTSTSTTTTTNSNKPDQCRPKGSFGGSGPDTAVLAPTVRVCSQQAFHTLQWSHRQESYPVVTEATRPHSMSKSKSPVPIQCPSDKLSAKLCMAGWSQIPVSKISCGFSTSNPLGPILKGPCSSRQPFRPNKCLIQTTYY